MFLIVALSGTGILSLGVVPPEELETTKPQLQVNQSGGNLTIEWEARPEVYYFMEGAPDLTAGTPWVTAKLLKDNDTSGSLTLGTAVSGSKAFYRLNLEGDPDSARLREDSDGDGIINLLEVEAGWDAYVAEDATDSDSDGIPDYFEQFHFGTLEHDASYVAVAGGLTLGEAFANATDPNSADSDGDGFSDAQEISWGWDPNYDQSRDDLKYGLEGDFDGDGLTNAQEAALGLNPTSTDTDGDGVDDSQEDYDNDNVVNVNDAVPDDGEINWEKAPESRYVWLPQVERTGARAVSRHGHILFPWNYVYNSIPDAQSEILWDSVTSTWVNLPLSGSWTGHGLLLPFNDVVFNQPVYIIDDMNDDGAIVGQSAYGYYYVDYPVLNTALMLWERSGPSTNQYSSPTYLVPSSSYTDDDGDGDSDFLAETINIVSSQPRIADDASVSCNSDIYSTNGFQIGWVTEKTNSGEHVSNMNQWLVLDSDYNYGQVGAILDENTGLFFYFDSYSYQNKLYYRDSNGIEHLAGFLSGFNSYNDPIDSDISRVPTAPNRVWFTVNDSVGGAVFIEKRDGGSGTNRWHNPHSMSDGAIKMNALGEAITETQLWRNGSYTDINDLVGNADDSTVNITKLIDLASNGIILAEADDNGTIKTGLLLKVEIEWQTLDGKAADEDPDDQLENFTVPSYYSDYSTKDLDWLSGLRYFPGGENSSATSLRNILKAKVSIPGLGGQTVKLRAFDVDDITPSFWNTDGEIDDSDTAGDDNLDDFEGSIVGVFVSSGDPLGSRETEVTLDNDGEAEVLFRVSPNPGSNYRVAVTLDQFSTELDALQVSDSSQDSYVTADDEQVSGFPGTVSPLLAVWRKLHIEVDSMDDGPPVEGDESNIVTGSISSYLENTPSSGQSTLTLDLRLPNEEDRFQDGKITITNFDDYEVLSNTDNLISNDQLVIDGTPGSGVIGEIFLLEDDDDLFLAEAGLPGSLPKDDESDTFIDAIKPKYAPAFIEVVNANTMGLNPNTRIDFKLNEKVIGFGNVSHFDNAKDLNDSTYFWAHALVFGYQPQIGNDNDPEAEAALYGGTPKTGLLNNQSVGYSVVYAELFREFAFTPKPTSASLSNPSTLELYRNLYWNWALGVAAHEIGHSPGQQSESGDHDENGLMQAGGANIQRVFSTKSLKRFRSTSSWSQ